MVTVVFAVYVGGLLGALLTVGSQSDRLGRRPVLITALLIRRLLDGRRRPVPGRRAGAAGCRHWNGHERSGRRAGRVLSPGTPHMGPADGLDIAALFLSGGAGGVWSCGTQHGPPRCWERSSWPWGRRDLRWPSHRCVTDRLCVRIGHGGAGGRSDVQRQPARHRGGHHFGLAIRGDLGPGRGIRRPCPAVRAPPGRRTRAGHHTRESTRHAVKTR